ncbi:MAG: S1/P1 nuclease [Alistipes sp.]|nr:S1/P1 nuclease [Alistipes sp.]
MRKFFTLVLAAALCSQAFGWGGVGHRVIVEIAQRNLTEKAKENISKYMNYDLKKEAVWMDIHRTDEPIAYTTSWHVYNVDGESTYDPNPRLYKGDCVHALKIADYNLSRYEKLTDSAVVFNLRMLLHFVGDLHCPTHSYVPGPRCFWPCTLNGKKYKFHGVYDKMPQLIHAGKKDNDIAAELDVLKKCQIKKIVKGDLHEWVAQIGSDNKVIYEWNPHNTPVLRDDTIELSTELVNKQMTYAGYRLAYLLNKYFGK